MPLPTFKSSSSLSLGVELELQLINLNNFDLTAASPDILELLTRNSFPGNVTPEITQSMIEISTDVHYDHASLLAQLIDIRDTLIHAAEQLNIGICGGGTHPFQLWSQRKIFARPRFKEISTLYGYLAQQFTIFGQHIHIGCTQGDQALFLLHALNRYVPHFIALSASSPFVQGHDTLFDSSRLNSVFAFPLSGRAPFLLDWKDFVEQYFEKMARTGIVNSMKDFYWDIRPKPEYGTVELRVCDTPLTVERAAALAGYLQTLCCYLLSCQHLNLADDDYLVYNYNRFQACRFGLDGTIVHPQTYQHIILRADILGTLSKLQPYSVGLNSEAALAHIKHIVEQGNEANYLRKIFAQENCLESVVTNSLQRFSPNKVIA